ncbi:hypothetical protein ACPPVV_11645 [Rhodanobacter sp. Col0626]|uniref:hypothetical protein n=1 Tax=Rhodanobacter sp. Col0626 TaxID=3415679 RepID=UPI003CF14AB1
MSKLELIPDELRQQRSAEIAKSTTFRAHGVSKQAALDYLETPDGEKYFQHLRNAAPDARLETITDRAVQQITSGRELPRMVTIGPNEPLVKLTRLGDDVSPHSAYLTKGSTVNEALASGRSLHDYFGLPARSEAPRYRMDEFRPLAPTEVFISRVAPTSELGGQITRSGGGEQYLAPNRTLFAASTHLRNIDNTLNLAAEVERGGLSPNLIRGAGALAAATVVYEATTTTVRSVDLLRQGNVTGAHSRIEHFASSTVGGLGQGAVGAEIGSFGGPVGTVVGGAMGYGLGAFGGEKLMDAYDNHKIYNQTDAQGQTWSYDPKQPQQGWTSDIPPLPGTPQDQHFTADPALANRLTYQANNTAVELAIAHPAEPRDPYTQPAAAHDTPSRIAAPWNRDAQTMSIACNRGINKLASATFQGRSL